MSKFARSVRSNWGFWFGSWRCDPLWLKLSLTPLLCALLVVNVLGDLLTAERKWVGR